MPLVGQRDYLRAVDVYAAVQELVRSDHVEFRFLRPTCHPLRASSTRDEGAQLIARVHCRSSGTRLFLTAVTDRAATRLAEPDLIRHQYSADRDSNKISFDFARSPSDTELLSVIFSRYQDVFATKCIVSRLQARPSRNRPCGKFTLQVSKQPKRSGVFVATVADDEQTRFTIDFKLRASST